MVLQAFFDESSDSHNTPPTTFVVAGFVSTAEKWAEFSERWQQALDEDGLEFYKAGKLKTQKSIKKSERYFRIIEQYVDAGVYCIVDMRELVKTVNDFDLPDIFFDPVRIKKNMRNPYHFAFKNIVKTLVENQETLNLFTPIDMIFDEKTESTAVLGGYHFLQYTAPSDFLKKMGSVPSFKKDHEILPLQAADLYAGWVRKYHLEGVNLRKNNPFPWVIKKPIHTLYMYLNTSYFLDELNALMSDENIGNLVKYMEDNPPASF